MPVSAPCHQARDPDRDQQRADPYQLERDEPRATALGRAADFPRHSQVWPAVGRLPHQVRSRQQRGNRDAPARLGSSISRPQWAIGGGPSDAPGSARRSATPEASELLRPGTRAALGDHQRTDRLDRAVTAFRRAERPAGQGGAGGADGIQRVGLALAAAVLPIAAIHLDDPHTGRRHVPGQAGAVTAGPLDPDQAHGPEPTQPTQQPGVASRSRRELRYAQQPADRIKRRGDMHVRMSVHPAGNSACLYDGQRHPLFRLRDGTHRWPVGPGNPGLLHRPGRSDRQRRWCQNLGPGRQIVPKTTRAASAESEVRPGPRPPTLRARQAKTRQAEPEALHTSSPPILCIDRSR